MKIEKLGNDKIKVTVTINELSVWDINPYAISPDSPNLREFISSLIKQSCEQTDTSLFGSNILVEARAQGDDFVFVITRTGTNFEDMQKEISKSLKKQRLINGMYKASISSQKAEQNNNECNLYVFSSLANFSYMLKSYGCDTFTGTTLYKSGSSYIIYTNNEVSDKCRLALSEYASRLPVKSPEQYLGEHAAVFASPNDYESIMKIY